MKAVALKAFPRTLARRSGAKKLRTQGRIPAVIYGARREKSASLEIDAEELGDLVHHSRSENLLVNLSVEGGSGQCLALLQEVQHHPLSGKMLHVDLHEVGEEEKVSLMVPVETEGEPVGVRTNGGVLEHVLFKIKVRAKPADLPEVITVDVAHLDIGQAIHLGEIKPPPNCELVGEKSVVVIAVAAPVTEAEETAAAEAAAAPGEVEMIKEKREGDEEAGAAKPDAKAGAKADAKPGAKPEAKAADKAPAADKAAEKKPAAEKKK
jgi:large subunit ribosomal protein L25